MLTLDEVAQRIAKAFVDIETNKEPILSGETELAATARVANVPEGHIISFCQEWGITISDGTDLYISSTKLKQLEAQVIMPLQHPPAASAVTVQGHGNAVNVGDHNTATVNVSYNYVLEQLREEIERSSMPEAEKKSALAKLGELAAVEGIKTILGLGAKFLMGG